MAKGWKIFQSLNLTCCLQTTEFSWGPSQIVCCVRTAPHDWNHESIVESQSRASFVEGAISLQTTSICYRAHNLSRTYVLGFVFIVCFWVMEAFYSLSPMSPGEWNTEKESSVIMLNLSPGYISKSYSVMSKWDCLIHNHKAKLIHQLTLSPMAEYVIVFFHKYKPPGNTRCSSVNKEHEVFLEKKIGDEASCIFFYLLQKSLCIALPSVP